MRNLAVVASLAVVALANSATAELLTFDHLPSTLESSIPVGLGEFEWSADFEYLTGAEVGGGYANGDVSPPNVAFNGYGGNAAFGRSTPFELDSFYLTAAWRTGLMLRLSESWTAWWSIERHSRSIPRAQRWKPLIGT
jgi:hypothetical protein